MVPQLGPHGAGDNGLFIHSYLSEFPVKEVSNETRKTCGHLPRNPTRTEGLHTMGAAWFPKAFVDGTAVTTHSAVQPTARYLPEHCWLACVVATLSTLSAPRLLPPHKTQGTDSHITQWYEQRVGFMGVF